jgi:sterol 14-demethylase
MSMAAELAKAAATSAPGAEVAAAAKAAGCPMHAQAAPTAAAPTTAAQPAPAAAPKSLRVLLDRDLCQGHAVCVGEAPELFRIGSDGRVEAIVDEVPPALHHKARQAAAYCPTRTIRLSD